MTTLTIRGIPEEEVARLKERARANGQSMEAFLRGVLGMEAQKPTLRETLDTLKEQPVNDRIRPGDVLSQIDSDRAERELEIRGDRW